MNTCLDTGNAGICTGITPHRRKKNLRCLYIDDVEAGSYHKEALIKTGIREGKEISSMLLEALKKEENYFSLREQAMRWLTVRDHCTGEIKKKALKKGYNTEVIAKVTEELARYKLIDDATFSKAYTREKARRSGWGPLKIQASLSEKGIKKEYIFSALKSIFTDDYLDKALFSVAINAKTKINRKKSEAGRKHKLIDFLLRRGFPADRVFEKSDEILSFLKNEADQD